MLYRWLVNFFNFFILRHNDQGAGTYLCRIPRPKRIRFQPLLFIVFVCTQTAVVHILHLQRQAAIVAFFMTGNESAAYKNYEIS